MLGTELTACSGDVAAMLPADRGINFIFLQNALECENIVPWRSRKIALHNEIDRYEIDMAHWQLLKHLRKLFRMLRLIVNTAHQRVFERDSAPCFRHIK